MIAHVFPRRRYSNRVSSLRPPGESSSGTARDVVRPLTIPFARVGEEAMKGERSVSILILNAQTKVILILALMTRSSVFKTTR